MTEKTAQDKIEKIVDLSAPVSRVWTALTDYEQFGEWFRVTLDGPFKVGEITRGTISYPGYGNMPWESRTERMDHERLFSFYWPVGDHDSATGFDINNPDVPKTLVEFRLEVISNGTRLTITESGFASIPDPRRLEAFRENTEGWDEQAKNITAYVGS